MGGAGGGTLCPLVFVGRPEGELCRDLSRPLRVRLPKARGAVSERGLGHLAGCGHSVFSGQGPGACGLRPLTNNVVGAAPALKTDRKNALCAPEFSETCSSDALEAFMEK